MAPFLSEYLLLFINLTLPGFFYLIGVLVLIQAFTENEIIKIDKKNKKFLVHISILVVVFSFIIGLTAHLALQDVKRLIIYILDNGVQKSLKIESPILINKASYVGIYGVLIMIRHLILSILFLFNSIAFYEIRKNKGFDTKWLFFIIYSFLILILSLAYDKIRTLLNILRKGESDYWVWIFVGVFSLLYISSLIMILFVKSSKKNS